MKITAQTAEEFRDQLLQYFNQPKCKDVSSIVYFWRVERPIPRTRGESNILYIGKATTSLYARYSSPQQIDIEMKCFARFYRHVIEKYGPLFIDIEETTNPKHAEWENFQAYYDEHLERPPLNLQMIYEPKTT